MSHASSLKLGLKLCALAVLLGSLAFLASNPTGRAQTGPGCDNNYQYCYTTCQSETNPKVVLAALTGAIPSSFNARRPPTRLDNSPDSPARRVFKRVSSTLNSAGRAER